MSQINFVIMQRSSSNKSLIAIIGLLIIVSGCINENDVEQKSNLTQNITIDSQFQSTITADVETGLVKLSHRSGDEIPMSDFTIIIEQGDLYSIYENLSQVEDKFAKGDTINLTQKSLDLNGKLLNAKISINNSGVTGNSTTITLLSKGNIFARIVSSDEFFG
jgi:PBP1b-binding outer membrane lipoprotein LpoB